jgi:beta-glucanase (GH16 family)
MTRRWVGAAIGALLLAAPASAIAAGGSPSAHAAAKTATSILHKSVTAKGKYLVVISVRSRSKHSRLVRVYLSGQKMRTVVANPWWGATVRYTLSLSPTKLVVRTVNAPPAVQIRATVTLRKSATTPKPKLTTSSPSTPTTTGGTTPPTTTTTPTTPSPPAQPAGAPYSSTYRTLVWSDEFTGAQGTTDSNWTPDLGPDCPMSDCSTDTASPANASLDGNGHMAITALATGNPSEPYTAAQLETPAMFHVGEELDASIELPAGEGLWGGFWFYEGSCTPNCGELDVMEAPEFGPLPTEDFFDLHGPISGLNGANGSTAQWETAESWFGNLSGSFHTYGIIWSPGLITWTIDGTPFETATPASLALGSTWEFDSGNYKMLLDLAVGGWPCSQAGYTSCPTASTAFPATMLVDWVHVYQ